MSKDKEHAKHDKKLAGETMVDLVGGLLAEHADKIYSVHKKMDGALGVAIRLSLKHDDGKLTLKTTIAYSTDQVKDHAEETVDFEQGTINYEAETTLPAH